MAWKTSWLLFSKLSASPCEIPRKRNRRISLRCAYSILSVAKMKAYRLQTSKFPPHNSLPRHRVLCLDVEGSGPRRERERKRCGHARADSRDLFHGASSWASGSRQRAPETQVLRDGRVAHLIRHLLAIAARTRTHVI